VPKVVVSKDGSKKIVIHKEAAPKKAKNLHPVIVVKHATPAKLESHDEASKAAVPHISHKNVVVHHPDYSVSPQALHKIAENYEKIKKLVKHLKAH
jgi:hypothetical protein